MSGTSNILQPDRPFQCGHLPYLIVRYGMISAACWSTRLVGILLSAGIVTTLRGEDPFSVLSGFQQQLSGISTLQASITRRQIYRDVARDARGVLHYDRTIGTRYEWKSPGHYLFFSSDSLLYGVDMNKRCGWKDALPDPEHRRQTDPLGRLLRLQSVAPEEFSYRGNNDSLLFFTLATERRTFCTIGIEPDLRRCRIIERFAEKRILLEKTVFSYGKSREQSAIPETIIISGMYGSDLSVDTITISRRRLNKPIKKEVFSVSGGVHWKESASAGSLPQEELHTAPGGEPEP